MKMLVVLLALICLTAHSQTRLQPWPDATAVAREGESFAVPAQTVVWYGLGTRWVTRVISGQATCSNALFGGDPFFGTVKYCVVEYPPPWISPEGLVFPKTTGVDAACAPAPLGRGTLPIVDVNGAGVMLGYWCHATATKPTMLSLFAVHWWALDVHLVGKLVAAMFSADIPAAIRALAAERASVPIEKLIDVWGPSQARLIAARPASAPQ